MDIMPANVTDKILKRRALELAKPISAPRETEGTLSLLEFQLGMESYAVDARYVQEVVSTTNMAPLPNVPPFILGIISVRGLIWSIMDLRIFFNIPKRGISDYPRAILINTPDLRFGFMTDSTLKILHPDSLRPPPEVTERIPRSVVKGTTNELTVVLDLEVLAKDPRMIIKDSID